MELIFQTHYLHQLQLPSSIHPKFSSFGLQTSPPLHSSQQLHSSTQTHLSFGGMWRSSMVVASVNGGGEVNPTEGYSTKGSLAAGGVDVIHDCSAKRSSLLSSIRMESAVAAGGVDVAHVCSLKRSSLWSPGSVSIPTTIGLVCVFEFRFVHRFFR